MFVSSSHIDHVQHDLLGSTRDLEVKSNFQIDLSKHVVYDSTRLNERNTMASQLFSYLSYDKLFSKNHFRKIQSIWPRWPLESKPLTSPQIWRKTLPGLLFFLIWFIHHSSWSWWQNHDTSRNIMRITDKQGQIQGWLLGSKPLADRKTASSAGGGGRCFERICSCESFLHPSCYNTLVIIPTFS